MTFLLRERKDVLLEVAKELRVEFDITLPKIEFKKRICQSKYYDEESVKCLLEGILEEEREERKLIREFELERLRAQLRNKLNGNKLKAGNRINDLTNVCILSENRTTEVSEPVNKCRPLINPVVNKSAENATSCDFEKKNCDPQCNLTTLILRLLEQIGVSRMVDIDILIQIWKNHVKKMDFVLKWLSRVGSEVGPTKGGVVTSSIVVNPHLSISVMVSPAGQGHVRRYRLSLHFYDPPAVE
ncbi:hypothetical protein TNCV_2252791 [Trichonephila clavipes]|nr:hypothetical protein TNCV_2252791 [Trichonephila clavipes]